MSSRPSCTHATPLRLEERSRCPATVHLLLEKLLEKLLAFFFLNFPPGKGASGQTQRAESESESERESERVP